MKKLSILTLVLLFAITSSNAQLKYRSDGRLTFGPVEPIAPYTTHINAWGHYYSYVGSGYNTFMKICLGAAAPRISGTLDQIVFYNSETSTFNSIQVANVYNYSDARAKTNIQDLGYGVNTIKQLRPVSYDFINSGKTKPQKEIGLIAQEVEKIMPELVYTDPDGKKLLNYTSIIPVLINAIQELQKEVDELKRK